MTVKRALTENQAARYRSAVLVLTLLVAALQGSSHGAQITTVVYVNRHFEVREHGQPTKYVYNGNTRVAEVTGSLSARKRLQRLRLFAGWNLCSLAVDGNLASDAISAAFLWDPMARGYAPVRPGQELPAGSILWINVITNTTVSILGTYADPGAPQVSAGGAYVATTGLEAWSPTLTNENAWTYDSAAGKWLEHLTGTLATSASAPLSVSPGEALFVEVPASAALAPPNPGLHVRYYHPDHLGSASVIADGGGKPIREMAYFAGGSLRVVKELQSTGEHYGFTQTELDTESRLNYFEARYLACSLTRFITPDILYLSPDTLSGTQLAGFLSDSQRGNVYAYALTNPLRCIDPTGHDDKIVSVYSKPETEDLQQLDFGNGFFGAMANGVQVLSGKGTGPYKAGAVVGNLSSGVDISINAYRFAEHPSWSNLGAVGWSGLKAVVLSNPLAGLAQGCLDMIPDPEPKLNALEAAKNVQRYVGAVQESEQELKREGFRRAYLVDVQQRGQKAAEAQQEAAFRANQRDWEQRSGTKAQTLKDVMDRSGAFPACEPENVTIPAELRAR